MELEGVVTNIVAFGAFVDIGVHQDGLVHVSQLADRYVKDPNAVVKVGQRVKVRVLTVDLERNRIALSMKKENAQSAGPGQRRGSRPKPQAQSQTPRIPKPGEIAPNGMRFR
jgi:uncharacterized protein